MTRVFSQYFIRLFLTVFSLSIFSPCATTEASQVCFDSDLKIQFYCEDQWEIQKSENAALIILSLNPDAVLIIAKINTPIVFLEQLTKEKLIELKQYVPGFEKEELTVAGQRAYKVKAFSKASPNKRLVDYYFFYNNELYGLLFAVEPKEELTTFQFTLQKIVDSIQFMRSID